MLNLYTSCSIGDALEKMAQGLRYIRPDPDYLVPNTKIMKRPFMSLMVRGDVVRQAIKGTFSL